MPLFCVGSAKPFVKPVENSDNFDHPQIIFTEGIKSEFLRCFCAMWSPINPPHSLALLCNKQTQNTIETKNTKDTDTKLEIIQKIVQCGCPINPPHSLSLLCNKQTQKQNKKYTQTKTLWLSHQSLQATITKHKAKAKKHQNKKIQNHSM